MDRPLDRRARRIPPPTAIFSEFPRTSRSTGRDETDATSAAVSAQSRRRPPRATSACRSGLHAPRKYPRERAFNQRRMWRSLTVTPDSRLTRWGTIFSLATYRFGLVVHTEIPAQDRPRRSSSPLHSPLAPGGQMGPVLVFFSSLERLVSRSRLLAGLASRRHRARAAASQPVRPRAPFTVGAEEELLLIDAETFSRRRRPSTRSPSAQAIAGSRASSAAPRSRR